jgi:hypothetical protein
MTGNENTGQGRIRDRQNTGQAEYGTGTCGASPLSQSLESELWDRQNTGQAPYGASPLSQSLESVP